MICYAFFLSSLASIKLSLLPVYSFVVCFAFVWGRILYPFSKCLMLKVFKISRLAFFPLNGTQLVLSKLFLFFLMIIKIYLTKKFSKNVCDPIFIVVKYGEVMHESNWFLWWTQPLSMLIPGLLTWRLYFLLLPPLIIVLLLTICHLHTVIYHKIRKGIKSSQYSLGMSATI